MKKLLTGMVVGLIIFGLNRHVTAAPSTYHDLFPQDDSTVVASIGIIDSEKIGYFWSKASGHSVSEIFADTGLEYIDKVDVHLEIAYNSLKENIYWDFFVNDIDVGDWSWTPDDNTGTADLSFSFTDILGEGTYDIAMRVSNEIAPGRGSIALGLEGDLVLYGDTGQPVSIPEPGMAILFSTVFAVLFIAGISRSSFKASNKQEVLKWSRNDEVKR